MASDGLKCCICLGAKSFSMISSSGFTFVSIYVCFMSVILDMKPALMKLLYPERAAQIPSPCFPGQLNHHFASCGAQSGDFLMNCLGESDSFGLNCCSKFCS